MKLPKYFRNYKIFYDAKGYAIIWMNGKNKKIHVLVWEEINGKKPDKHEIHHIDGDRSNYDINNLQLLSCSDHHKLHAGWLKTNGKWTHKPCNSCGKVLKLKEFYKRKGYTPTAKCKKCHCIDTRKWALKNKEKRRIISANYWRRKNGKEVVPYA